MIQEGFKFEYCARLSSNH